MRKLHKLFKDEPMTRSKFICANTFVIIVIVIIIYLLIIIIIIIIIIKSTC